ncbi:hypothetical protein ACIRD8_26900 [Streptomyces sp. NPDC102451]|uniref:hypothetical protein n=1 Tax=Streptomyces sp. NPDC102451 TaxID=3366177 RepID=UPI00380D4314
MDNGAAPPPATPRTHGEWHARFPELGQFLGGWFSQEMVEESDYALAVAVLGMGVDPPEPLSAGAWLVELAYRI